MDSLPEFVPLDASDEVKSDKIPIMLFSGYSEAEVSRIVDLIYHANIRPPAAAMIPETIHGLSVGEYLSIIREEHQIFHP